MIGVIDYGVGNLYSLNASFRSLGAELLLSDDPAVLAQADRLILPGVGAFGDAAEKLREKQLDLFLQKEAEKGKLILGICLGMQLLFEKSYEYGEHKGLGLIKGRITPIADQVPAGLKIPHMGWNALQLTRPHPLFSGIREGDCVYFVHSYAAVHCDEDTLARTEYGAPLTAAVGRENVLGCQFHPEKSGKVGLSILKAFCEMEADAL